MPSAADMTQVHVKNFVFKENVLHRMCLFCLIKKKKEKRLCFCFFCLLCSLQKKTTLSRLTENTVDTTFANNTSSIIKHCAEKNGSIILLRILLVKRFSSK